MRIELPQLLPAIPDPIKLNVIVIIAVSFVTKIPACKPEEKLPLFILNQIP